MQHFCTGRSYLCPIIHKLTFHYGKKIIVRQEKKNDDVEKWSHKHDYPITDIWNTNHVLAGIIVSRLWAFKDHDKHGMAPGCADMDEWNKIIQKMIDAFALLKHIYAYTDEENRVIEEGLDLFRKYFRYLWD